MLDSNLHTGIGSVFLLLVKVLAQRKITLMNKLLTGLANPCALKAFGERSRLVFGFLPVAHTLHLALSTDGSRSGSQGLILPLGIVSLGLSLLLLWDSGHPV